MDKRPILRPLLRLGAPSPNPASGGVDLELQLPSASSVRAQVIDIVGREVASLTGSDEMSVGVHRLHWNCRDAAEHRVAPGVYLLRVSAGTMVALQRMVVLR